MMSNLEEAMRGFPSFLDLDTPGLTQERLRGLLYNLEEEADDDDICDDETICKLNFKTWIYTKLENLTKAEEINNEAIQKTKWENLMSIGNRIFLCWRTGKEIDARECLEKLRHLKESQNISEKLEIAKAELAYSYFRIGGPGNLLKAINILEEFVRLYPREYFWKLRLGLVYRRSARYNINAGMSQGPTIKECIIKAHTFLTDVASSSTENKLKGPAFSELAVLCKYSKYDLSKEDYTQIFKGRSPPSIAKEALKYGRDSTWVMTNCGLVFWNDEAISILTHCLTLREHTTTHHRLGSCYYKEAKADAAKQKGINTPIGYRNYEVDNLLLKLPNKNFDKAKFQFIKAIEISHNRNVPAIFDLGMLYKLAGLHREALETFNKVTNGVEEDHMISVISANEQAGLCYLQMGDEISAEEKLTRAIVLAVKAASSCPELPIKAAKIWNHFRDTQERLNDKNVPAVETEELKQLLKLVNTHSNVVTVVKYVLTLTDRDLKDSKTVMGFVNSYLEKNEPEKALTVLNMLSLRPDITTSDSWRTQEMIKLMYKVFLLTAENRLKCQSNARFIFQDLFKLKFGQCTRDVSNDEADDNNIQDVLLLYDEYSATERGSTIKTIEGLQEIVSSVFGLSSNTNLQNCLKYGNRLTTQLKEMKRYKLIIVVLGHEKRSHEFQELLEKIPGTISIPTNHVSVIDASQHGANLPDVLKQYNCFKLEENMCKIFQHDHAATATYDGDQDPSHDIVKKVCQHSDAVMQLFSFIIQ